MSTRIGSYRRWWTGTARRTARVVAFVLLLFSLDRRPAEADRLIYYEDGELTEAEWLLIEPLFELADQSGFRWVYDIVPEDRLSGGPKRRLAAALDIVRHHMLQFAHLDVNGDGKEDLLVWVADTMLCNAEGCLGYLFERYGGWWNEVGLLSVDSNYAVCLMDVMSFGRPVLLFGRMAAAWTGSRYVEMCIEHCAPDFTSPTRAKLPPIELLRQHLSCPSSPHGSGR